MNKLMDFFHILLIIGFILILGGCNKFNIEETNQFKVQSDVYTSGLYPTIDGIYHKLNILKSKYSDKVKLYKIGYSSELKKPIPLLRIQSGKKSSSENFLFVAGTHGDEALPVKTLLYTINKLLKNSQESYLLGKDLTIDFIPLHNPDGYVKNQRKNSNGVDLNRNFPFKIEKNELQSENKAIINLINSRKYQASIFFHSANEKIYENIIRVPIEKNKMGIKAFSQKTSNKLKHLIKIIKSSCADTEPRFTESSEMVNKSGIASDWCMSSLIKESYKKSNNNEPKFSHPSLTIELCYPKQPLNKSKIEKEKNETFQIVANIIQNYK